MSRQSWVYRDGELIPKHEAPPLIPRGSRSSAVAAPYITCDGLGLHGVRSMADGKFYDSKSTMRRHYKQAGVREIGNEVNAHLKDIQDRRPQKPKVTPEFRQAFDMVKQGYKPPPPPAPDPDLD